MPQAKENTPRFEILGDTASAEFREAMKVYSASFPVHERRDEGTIERRVREGFYRMHIGRLGGRVVFLALIHELAGTDFALFDYMATEPSLRNRGIGAAFLRTTADDLKRNGRYLILEVEDPALGPNKAERARRLKLYRREGAREMKGVHYLMPVKPGYEPEKMVLMILPQYGGGKMPGRLVRDVITRIYREVYGRDSADSLLNSFLNDVPSVVDLV
jgi:GNAT superfamily N-acetyltransferase